MAVEVSRLMVKVGADTADAERGLQRAQAAVQGFSGFLRQAAASAIGFATAMVGMRTVDSVVSAAREAMIGFNASMQQSEIRWKNLLGNADAARAMILDLQRTALQKGLDFEQVDEGIRRLTNLGTNLSTARNLIIAINQAAAGLGLGQEAIDRITTAIGQMVAKGKVGSEEMTQQLGELIPAWQILADHIGVTVAKAQEMAEKGQIAPQQFVDAFIAWTTRKFPGALDEMANTWDGAMRRIRTAGQIAAGTAFEPLFRRLNELAKRIADFVVSDQFQAWGARVAATIEVVLEGLGVLGDGFRVALSGIASIVTTVGQIIYEALQLLNPFARHSPSLVESVSQGVDIILNRFASLRAVETPLRAAGDAVRALGEAARGGLAALEAATESAQMKALAVFGSAVPAAFRAAQQAVAALESQLSGLQAAIQAQESVLAGVKAELDAAAAAVRAKEAAIRALEREMRNYDAAVEAAETNVQRMREAVDRAKGVVDGLRDAISQAQDRIRQLAGTPIQGTKEFRDRLADINQQINETQLQLTRLKLAGAPQEEIEALEKQLEQLRLQAEETRLEEAVQFDPLRKQIEDLTDTTQELPFEDIVRGIKEQQASLVNLQAQLGPATAAWEQQVVALRDAEAGLKAAQAARDEFRKRIEAERDALEQLREFQNQVQERYAAEQARLSELKDAYSAVQQQIEQYRKAIDDVLQRAEQQVRLNEQAAKAAETAAAASAATAAAVGQDPLAGFDVEEAKKKIDDWKEQFEKTKNAIRDEWMPTFERLRDELKNVGDRLKEASDTLNLIKEPLSTIAALAIAAVGAFMLFRNVIAPVLGVAGAILGLRTAIAAAGGVIPAIVAALGGPLTIALAGLAAVLGGVYLAWNNNWLGMRDTINQVTSDIASWIRGRLSIVISWVESNLPLIQETFNKVLSFIRDNIVRPWLEMHQKEWQGKLLMLQEAINTAWSIITISIDTYLQNILSLIRTVLLLINGDWQGAWDEVQTVVSRTWEAIKSIVGLAASFVYDNLIKPMLDRISSEWESVWSTVKQVTSSIWDGIKLAVRTGVNAIIEALNTLIRAWNQLEFRIPGFDVEIPSIDVPGVGRIGGGRLGWPGIAIGTPDIPPIPALATGGLTTRETLALLHPGEAVIPLRDSAALDVLAGRIADAITRRPQQVFNLTAQYRYQDERSLRDEIRLLQLLGAST